MKLTRGHSCVLCQQRKVRCDKQKPCANCVKAGVECRVVPPQPPRRRKKKPHERDLIERLKKYEQLLSQNGVQFEPLGNEFKPLDGGGSLEDVADLEQDLSGLKTSPSTSNPEYNSGESPHGDKKWYPYIKEYRTVDDVIRDSSDEEDERPTIHHAFDSMFENTDGFPFVVGGSPSSVTSLHPSAIQIFQLWQVYINNVNPLLKISHVPTLQGQIVAAGADPSKISKPLEVLMFAIYFIAVTSMRDEEVQSTFGEDRAVLLGKYHNATQQALVNASFMKSTELMVLQAYFLYLLAAGRFVDPRSLFCLLGIAVRIATRLGLHQDGARFGIPPFETEQRRRLWWQIVAFDKRIAEITGSTINALSSCGGDCLLPLNVNDTDLHVNAKDPPASYRGPTEMLFCLARIELVVAAAPAGSRPAPAQTSTKTRVQFSPSPSSPDVVTHVANQYLPADIDAYCTYMENAYLKHCDPKIPLHFFTLMMTRQALCKLRIVEFMCRGVPPTTLDGPEGDALFVEAVQMVELDNIIYAAEFIRGFLWYTRLNFPFPAYIFLVSALRRRTTGELCERAWAAIAENHERRGMMRNLRSPIHVALGSMFVKAWTAREEAENQLGRTVQPPKMITMLRQHMSRFPQRPRPAPAPSKRSSNGMPAPATTAASVPMAPLAPTNPGMGGSGPGPIPSTSGPPGVYVDGRPIHEAQTRQMASTMLPDDSMMLSFGAANQVFDSTMSDVAFDQMDWSYLLQYSGLPGFGGPPVFPTTDGSQGHLHGPHG
ncbi:hypothetical protein VTK73DRAFT_9841 [Phialemonium thermophilum]|uniref:Zn(2)-C6 fungal-type domain-containing protein n=1 Tax=Phialemonium thermophilum TaxID=223376 RepID=A0ABR3VZZ7_9PEZI